MRYAGFRALALVNRYTEDMIDLMYQGVDLGHAQMLAGHQIASAIFRNIWAKVEANWAVSTSFCSIFILCFLLIIKK